MELCNEKYDDDNDDGDDDQDDANDDDNGILNADGKKDHRGIGCH